MRYELRFALTGVALLTLAFSAQRLTTRPQVAYAAEPVAFSAEQGKQGQVIYKEKCGTCHGPDLDGGEHGPPLKAEAFWAEWDQQTARKFYGRILTSMPADDPGSLPEKDVIKIVTYILQANGFPSGGKEIEAPNDLNNIKIEKPK